LINIPAGGYTSAEFTCSYDPAIIALGSIATGERFGSDPATATNGPTNGTFVFAIAGNHNNKATVDGSVFIFDVIGLYTGQTEIACRARVPEGNTLKEIDYLPGHLIVVGESSPPTPTPAPAFTAPPPSSEGDWLTFPNARYGFEFKYPPDAQVLGSDSVTFVHINLPFAPGTNLGDKYMEVIVAENANPCQSPFAAGWSVPPPSETVALNGLTFFKQTGEDATAGHTNKWVAYSTTRDNVCVSLGFVLRAANPGMFFPTPPPLYDEALESAVFEQIASTFTWLALPPTPTPTPQPGLATITGQVLASKVVTVRLYDANENTAAMVNANADGTFRFDNIPAGTYTIVATANGFMRLQGTLTLAGGEVQAIAPIKLLAGDIDDSGIIDQFDALTIGFAYNTSEPPGADLNSDGIINVLDLELLARNYKTVGPIVWLP
jgi:hypothetical protein